MIIIAIISICVLGVQTTVPFHASIGILYKNSSGVREAGDMYIGTRDGVYLKKVNSFEIAKISGINEPVQGTYIDFNGGAFVITTFGNLFYININGENDQGIQNYIPNSVITLAILDKDGIGSRKAGDLYLGTSDGVYLKYAWTHSLKKIAGIHGPIIGIYIDFNGGAFVITIGGKLYYINVNGENNEGVQNYIPTSVYTLGICKESHPGSVLKPGDMYIGTTDGAYLKHVYTHNIDKVPGINGPIVDIIMDFDNGVYLISGERNVYYVNNSGINEGIQKYIPSKVFTIAVLLKDSAGNRKAGDAYLGTNDGVYLKPVGRKQLVKINGINGPIHSITIDHNGGAYIITRLNFGYYVDVNGIPAGFQTNLMNLSQLV